MELIKPNIAFEKDYKEISAEFRADGDNMLFPDVDLGKYIEQNEKMARGEDLPKDWVPSTKFWLIDEGQLIGEANIRHRLTEHLRNVGGHIGYSIRPSKRRHGYGTEILKLALIEAKKLGLESVLVTCDETNIGSKKIIEKNGGVFEKATNAGDGNPKKLLYWIKT